MAYLSFSIGTPYDVYFKSHGLFASMNLLRNFEMLIYWISQAHYERVKDIENWVLGRPLRLDPVQGKNPIKRE